jgi:hypothetical protein
MGAKPRACKLFFLSYGLYGSLIKTYFAYKYINGMHTIKFYFGDGDNVLLAQFYSAE